MLRVIGVSALVAVILSILLLFSLEFGVSFLWRFGEPLIVSVTRELQEPGISASSRTFPCQKEGFDTGCEAYKRFPLLLTVNAIVYFPFLVFLGYALTLGGMTRRYPRVFKRTSLVTGLLVCTIGLLLSACFAISIDDDFSYDWPNLILALILFGCGVWLLLLSRTSKEAVNLSRAPS